MKKDLVVKVGEYTKDGAKKAKYKNIGVMLDGDNGPYLLLDRTFNLAGVLGDRDTVLVSIYEPKDKNEDDPNSVPF